MLAGKYTFCPIHRHASPVKDTSPLIPPGKTPRMHKVGMLLVYRIPDTLFKASKSSTIHLFFIHPILNMILSRERSTQLLY